MTGVLKRAVNGIITLESPAGALGVAFFLEPGSSLEAMVSDVYGVWECEKL